MGSNLHAPQRVHWLQLGLRSMPSTHAGDDARMLPLPDAFTLTVEVSETVDTTQLLSRYEVVPSRPAW